MFNLRSKLQTFARHPYGLTLFAFLTAAALSGAASILFARLFEVVLRYRLDFESIGAWAWVITPVGFLLAVEIIRRNAPFAAGTGIPQAIFASEHFDPSTESALYPLVSTRTLVVKVVAILIGVGVGASTGREGPTVHIAVCVFMGTLFLFRRWLGLTFDLSSAAVAGGGAGLAAAFNTPLAGVTFAIEELSETQFSSIKDFVLMAIIVAAIVAKVLTGEYLYFGKLQGSPAVSLGASLLIGLSGGLLGALFSTLLLRGTQFFKKQSTGPGRYTTPVILSLALLAVTFVFGTRLLGPGNKVAQVLVDGQWPAWVYSFPLAKMAATLLTYWSGIAGGIFAPCLSMGAALGGSVGHMLNSSTEGCAVVGMAAFLSGSIQAPITSFVIIYEMTNIHPMLLPIMLASLLAYVTARLLGARHLYKALATEYLSLLSDEKQGKGGKVE